MNFLTRLSSQVKCALCIALGVLFVLLFVCFRKQKPTLVKKTSDTHCQQLVRQTLHWWQMSKDEKNVVLALVYVTVALSKVNSLTSLFGTLKVNEVVDVDLKELRAELDAYHRKVLKGVFKVAPHVPSSSMVDLDLFVS